MIFLMRIEKVNTPEKDFFIPPTFPRGSLNSEMFLNRRQIIDNRLAKTVEIICILNSEEMRLMIEVREC